MTKHNLWVCLAVNNVAFVLVIAMGGIFPDSLLRSAAAQSAVADSSCCASTDCNNKILVTTGGNNGDGCTKSANGTCTGTCFYCNGNDATSHCAVSTTATNKCVKTNNTAIDCGQQLPVKCAAGGGGTSGCCPTLPNPAPASNGSKCNPTECDNSSSAPC
jgi:hypothetical protein